MTDCWLFSLQLDWKSAEGNLRSLWRLVLVPHLLISQPSHLLSNYSVFFMLLQKPQCFFFCLFARGLRCILKRKSNWWGCSFCVFRRWFVFFPSCVSFTSGPSVSTVRGQLMQSFKSPSLSACLAVFLPPSCSLWVQFAQEKISLTKSH